MAAAPAGPHQSGLSDAPASAWAALLPPTGLSWTHCTRLEAAMSILPQVRNLVLPCP